MAGEWVDKAVGDIADVVGGSTPSTRDPANFDGDVPWLTPKDLSSPHSRYVKRGERNLSSKGFESCSAQLLPANSVLLSSRAPIGYLAIAANPIATNQGFRSLIVRPAYDHEFLYYWLSGNIEELERHSSGSTFKELSGTALKQIRLRLPVDRDEQRAIARILGTLDNKIELNRRMNATLEAMARALFQSWFVDFDPVRAKLDGRPPAALDPATAALFPEHLDESKLGHIPRGWEVKTIESLCGVITSGGTPARMHKAYWEPATVPWFKTGELMDGPLIDAEERISEDGLANSACKLWPAGTILFALYASPTVGRFGVLTKPGTANQAAAALIAKPAYGVPFLMGLLYEARAELQRVAVGAAQQNINQGVLKSHVVIAPPPALAKAYSDKVAPWFEQRIKLAEQSRTLATLRDTLLPKLLSGELSVAPTDKESLSVQNTSKKS